MRAGGSGPGQGLLMALSCFFLKVIKFRAGSYSFKCMVYHLINKHLGANNVFIMFGMDINAFPKG